MVRRPVLIDVSCASWLEAYELQRFGQTMHAEDGPRVLPGPFRNAAGALPPVRERRAGWRWAIRCCASRVG